jgi:hypothetical protein
VSKIGHIEVPNETQDVAAGCNKRNNKLEELSSGY